MNKIANKDIDIDELLMNLDKSQMFLMWLFSVSAEMEIYRLSHSKTWLLLFRLIPARTVQELNNKI